MTKKTQLLIGLSLAAAMFAGCDRTNSTESTPANSGSGITGMIQGKDVTGPHRFPTETPPSPGGAPTYGMASGMGFSTGNAAQSGGAGTGLMGFHGTGSAGTSGTITDTSAPHPAQPAEATAQQGH